MKYIKRFENDSANINIGYYVKINETYIEPIYLHKEYNEYVDFLNNNIGLVVNKFFKHTENCYHFLVKYDNIPKIPSRLFSDGAKWFSQEHIVEYGETLEDVEIKVLSKEKYNL